MTRAVLTFHSIDDSGSVLSFPVRAFSRLIESLARRGTPVVSFEELLSRRDGVTITFDDGMRSVREHALPVLKAHGFPAHLFLTTGRVGRGAPWALGRYEFEMLGWSDVDSCVAGNMSIECHTVTHPDLRQLSPGKILDECIAADDDIERHTGRRPAMMAFPFGYHNDEVVSAIGARYRACFSTRMSYLGDDVQLTSVPRLDSYYLKAPILRDRLLAPATRAYIGLRSLVRAVRGRS